MYIQKLDFIVMDGHRRVELDMNSDGVWITIRKWDCGLDEFEDVKLTKDEAIKLGNYIINLAQQIGKVSV